LKYLEIALISLRDLAGIEGDNLSMLTSLKVFFSFFLPFLMGTVFGIHIIETFYLNKFLFLST